ncbi:MAG: 23S rRNA (uracil(1939)-C(5))-methyltransferase RlmD [Clostridia bacterium]|nr:23S rRNA (uracil(1939)-C(5))-methyltransferase RlmD [Clostridia bacterium]
MLRKNDIFEMTCESFGQDAQGVCRHEGMAVFVPGLLPGERALVRIVKPEKRYAFGRIDKLLTESSERTEPFCPVYKRCGGCSCQHMAYETSLRFKQDQVQQLLSRVGGLDIAVPPVLGMDEPFAYRNKGAYPVAEVKGEPACGFFAPRSHDLVPLPAQGCRIQRLDSRDAAQAVLGWMKKTGARAYDEVSGKGLVRHIMTRSTRSGGLMVVLVVTRRDIPARDLLIQSLRSAVPGLLSVCLSINSRRTNVILGEEIHTLWGQPVMEDTLHGLKFSVSPLSFFQVNPEQTEKLYQLALDYAQLSGGETVVDAYCGAGTISLLLARRAKKVIGIEIVEPAIRNAEENAARNGVCNAEFIVGASEEVLPRLVAGGMRPDVIVVDPPRKGCEEAVLQAIIAAAPNRVVYVSCGAPTLARDAKILCEGGYRAEKVQCVDMFCWTGAVETVMLFSRPDSAQR